jgi:hypothetical protein
LVDIDNDLATRQNDLEQAANDWFRAKRERERTWATTFVSSDGPVDARKAAAINASCMIGVDEEARWEGLRAVVRVLGDRANIGMSLLRSQGRA